MFSMNRFVLSLTTVTGAYCNKQCCGIVGWLIIIIMDLYSAFRSKDTEALGCWLVTFVNCG